MHFSRLLRALLPVLLVTGLAVGNCTGNLGDDPQGPGAEGETVLPACDPDGVAPCPDDWFICTDDEAGNKYCQGQEPATPDGEGGWECYEEGTTLVCRGDHMPPDGSGWVCEDIGGSIVCRRHAYVPSGGGEGTWDCYYEGEFRVCEQGEGDGGAIDEGEGSDEGGGEGGEDDQGGDGGDDFWDDWFDGEDGGSDDWWEDLIDDWFDGGEDTGGDADVDADVDSDVDGDSDQDEDDCLCVPGAVRYCDEEAYCYWGTQVCGPRGLRWGPCVETSIPVECSEVDPWYSPEAEQCCIDSGFCCQDMWDLDDDGDTWESAGNCVDIVCE